MPPSPQTTRARHPTEAEPRARRGRVSRRRRPRVSSGSIDPLPAGCSYWKQASEGHAFYTTPEDHENCAVGAFTHGVTLVAGEGEGAGRRWSARWSSCNICAARKSPASHTGRRRCRSSPTRRSPRRRSTPTSSSFAATRGRSCCVSEAARGAGIFESAAAMGRPACAMIPQARHLRFRRRERRVHRQPRLHRARG